MPSKRIDGIDYNIATNSDGLVRDVARQVKDRAIHLPQGMKQRVMIDVRGQNVSKTFRANLSQKIIEKCEGIISARDIEFF